MHLTEFQAALIAVGLEDLAGTPCDLCGAPGTMVGIWTPTADCSRRLGAPEGKTRLMGYSLCAACHATPGACDRLERKILAAAEQR